MATLSVASAGRTRGCQALPGARTKNALGTHLVHPRPELEFVRTRCVLHDLQGDVIVHAHARSGSDTGEFDLIAIVGFRGKGTRRVQREQSELACLVCRVKTYRAMSVRVSPGPPRGGIEGSAYL